MGCIKDLCEAFDFPDDCVKFLDKAYLSLIENEQAREVFFDQVSLYENDYEFDDKPVFEQIEALSEKVGIHKYTLDLLYMLCLVPHLRELYIEKGIDLRIFHDSVCDLIWKAKECKSVYGVWGIFVGWWTMGFFKMKRFSLGRLQFNLLRFDDDFLLPDLKIQAGDLYIDTHIPSSGPLRHDDCIESYQKAAEFFKDYFIGKPVIFGCNSWLLSSNNYDILPPESNIITFMKDYTILKEMKDPTNSNLWRIFSVIQMPVNVEMLPQDTSLRRAFVQWLKVGNTIDTAFGIIVYDNLCERVSR